MYISLTARYCCCLYFRFRACVRRNYTSVWYTLCVVYLYISDDSYFEDKHIGSVWHQSRIQRFWVPPWKFFEQTFEMGFENNLYQLRRAI